MSDAPAPMRARWLARILLAGLALFWGVVTYDLLRATNTASIGPVAWGQWTTAAVSAAALGLTLRSLLAQFRGRDGKGPVWPRPRRRTRK